MAVAGCVIVKQSREARVEMFPAQMAMARLGRCHRHHEACRCPDRQPLFSWHTIDSPAVARIPRLSSTAPRESSAVICLLETANANSRWTGDGLNTTVPPQVVCHQHDLSLHNVSIGSHLLTLLYFDYSDLPSFLTLLHVQYLLYLEAWSADLDNNRHMLSIRSSLLKDTCYIAYTV